MNRDLIQTIDGLLAERGESRASASVAAGLGNSYIRDLERKKGSPNLAKLGALAKHLGVTIETLLNGTDIDLSQMPSLSSLPVLGVIAAGHFMDITLEDQDGGARFINVASDDRFGHAKQYALEIRGDSMNLMYPDGSFVTCVDYIGSGLSLKDGMKVHVERYMGDGQFVENTLKEYRKEDGRIGLYPRSSNPMHQPIFFNDGGEGVRVEIKGIVTGSWRPEVI